MVQERDKKKVSASFCVVCGSKQKTKNKPLCGWYHCRKVARSENKCKIQKLQRGVQGIVVPHLRTVVFAGLPVGGVFLFFKMLILVLIYHNSNMYNKKIPALLLHTKVKMQGIIE